LDCNLDNPVDRHVVNVSSCYAAAVLVHEQVLNDAPGIALVAHVVLGVIFDDPRGIE